MAKGYHSRSPEELKDFLKKVNQPVKKRRWVQIILYIDIFVLMIVFYFVAKNINPSLDYLGQKTEKIKEGDFQIYLEKSKETEKESANYFLFVKNTGNQIENFPPKDYIFDYRIKSSKGITCLSIKPKFDIKKIRPNETEFFSFSVSIKNFHELPKECIDSLTSQQRGIKKFFHREKGTGIFSISKESHSTEIILRNDTLKKEE
ncbi:MAG: hypothetical protein L6Q54_00680 [Leptospiraceae bacterium]|nr:hypothetical protein [Leptospiraceae bacterium]MCK6379752.1 hypothetical protein [Leptospiraceae bacterium]NUM40416.1 hypothetical protein [Leptospiraceae bacterium]